MKEPYYESKKSQSYHQGAFLVYALFVVLGLLGGVLWGAEPSITPLTETVEVGQQSLLSVDGFEADELTCAVLKVDPPDSAKVIGVTGWDGKPLIWFMSQKKGRSTIVLAAVRDGKPLVALTHIDVGKSNDEDEDDDVNPIPGELATLVLVEQKQDRPKLTPQQIALVVSVEWRDWCDQNKIFWRATDKDVALATPDLKAVAEAAISKGLPSFVLLDKDAKVISVEPLHQNLKATLEFLEKSK